MHALFVHGMGRTPMSGWRMLAKLRARGIATHTFGYATSLQDFDSIRNRLATNIGALSTQGDYVLIGHSLGGVLLRAALATLPTNTRLPRRVFLLGSPILSARLARTLQRNWIYRALTGDCGQLLSDSARMAHIGPSPVPVTSILGVTG